MPNRLFKAPLAAAFFYGAISVGCAAAQSVATTTYVKCSSATTPIAGVQGNRPTSPITGQQVTLQGIVTLVERGRGLYMEEPGSDRDTSTSNAIFVELTDLPGEIVPGSWIMAEGKVAEIGLRSNSLTALAEVTSITECSSGQVLPITDAALPLRGLEREALEGMRVRFSSTLTVTDNYRLNQGNLTLAGNGLQYTATEVVKPGRAAAEYARNNLNFLLPVLLEDSPHRTTFLANGSTITGITGVLAHDGNNLRMSLQSMAGIEPAPFAVPDPAAADELRVVGMNLKNFFNGDGNGGDFPTPRGARTPAEFDLQRQRLGAAIQALNPDVLAVMELENDGFGADSAAADFESLLEEATGATWHVARPAGDDTGTDAIKVGLFYRNDLLEATGPAQTLTGLEFRRSRQPLAQVFRQRQNGETILVVVNHLKSKGSCPDSGINASQKDGQGCWNPMRVTSAEKMSAWVKSLSASTRTPNIAILGDMNAYRQEDPINAIRAVGFIELLDQADARTYSFIYRGQAGTLDYAFVSATLRPQVQQAFIWNVNAALPANTDLPRPWLRFSDHDPVVIDIRLHQATTSD